MDDRARLWLQNLKDERDGAALYEGLAKLEKDPERARLFERLAEAERRHGALWAGKLAQAGVAAPSEPISSRIRALLFLARHFGVHAVLPTVIEAERADIAKYSSQGAEAAPLAREEEEHREQLSKLGGARAPSEAGRIIERERWHKGGRGGWIRAAVFGMSDGLVSNLSLVLGVAGAGVDRGTLLVTGFAGLLAGAFSMAAGEFTSVASQRDLLLRQIELERRELAEMPDEEAAELASIFEQKGLSPDLAARMTSELLANPKAALDTLIREELGLDPGDLGSPQVAAGSSFVTFSVGAAMPILPFLFLGETPAVLASAGVTLAILLGVGGTLGYLSGTGALRSALRMAGLAALAAGVTHLLGRLFGSNLT
jgi:VIT1/CCC1 family predicted Fe2+/Mn2+ transporter